MFQVLAMNIEEEMRLGRGTPVLEEEFVRGKQRYKTKYATMCKSRKISRNCDRN
jgi:hypothetical protein